MNILAVIHQIIMLLIITAVGLLLRQRRVLTDPVIKGLNSLVLQAAWPAMIISTTQKTCSDETLQGFILIACVTTVLLAAACVVLKLIVAKSQDRCSGSVFTMLAVMPNAGFVGLPLIQAAYGDLGILYLAAFLVGFNLVLWTLGVFLFTGLNLRSLKNLLNPGVISAVIGTLLFVLRIQLPTPLLSTANQLGALTTPLSMLLLGARLSQLNPAHMRQAPLWVATAFKLVFMPLAAMAIMRWLNADVTILGVTVMAMSMPSASACQMFAEKYETDVELSVEGVSVSMLLCLLTIPLVLLVTTI